MYDLIIKNGKVIDGTGSPSFFADVAIQDGKIARIAKNLSGAKKEIDAKGLTVTPGFIDSHSHNDNAILEYPEMIEKIEQGITTAVAGQCGGSAAPKIIDEKKDKYIDGIGQLSDICKTFGSFAKTTRNIALGCNTLCLVGHGSIRKVVMGMSQQKPNQAQLQEMKALVREAMEHGATGISFGLIYPPGCYADTEELVEMAKVVKEYDGIVAAHIRNEGDAMITAVKEFIEVIRSAQVRGVVSHHKACGAPENWGKVSHSLRLIDQANAEGVEIYLDVYPYIATHTTTSVTFVPDPGRDLMARLADVQEREKIKAQQSGKWWFHDYSWVLVTKCDGYPEYEGLFLPEAAKRHGKSEFDTLLDMIYESENNCSCCYFSMCEQDVETVMAHPRAMICTDAGVAKEKTTFHPRTKGTFPRVLGRYVRERNVTTPEEMIRKMTSMPARVYGLKTKGLVWEGMDADLCIWDADKILDHSDFTDCNRRAEGLSYVVLGGEVVVKDAIFGGKKMGRMILKNYQTGE